jgi:hypothetical protein
MAKSEVCIRFNRLSLFPFPNPANFYFCNDGYIGEATNRGSALIKISDGLEASQCFNVAVSQTDQRIVGCSTYHTGMISTGRNDFSVLYCSPWGQANLLRSRDGGVTGMRSPSQSILNLIVYFSHEKMISALFLGISHLHNRDFLLLSFTLMSLT